MKLQQCRQGIGVSAGESDDRGVAQWRARGLLLNSTSVPVNTRCICLNSTTTVQNVASAHCAAVETACLEEHGVMHLLGSEREF